MRNNHLAATIILCAFAGSLFAEWSRPDLVAKVAAGEISEARASWWGFDKEDSTACLQAAIDSGVPKLIVDKMPSPWIVTPVRGASNQHIIFERGAVLLAKRGAFKGVNDWLFYYLFAENATLTGYGAVFRMWREDYAKGKDGKGQDYKRGEWRHTLSIRNSCNITVEGLMLEESGGDGANVGIVVKPKCGPIGLDYGRGDPSMFCRDIVLRDLVCNGNHRQGLSVTAVENLLVENCIFKNTDGVWPMDGIDIEPDSPSNRIVNCTFRNCIAESNSGNGFEVALHQFTRSSIPASVRFENCITKGSRNSVVLRGASALSDGEYPKGTIIFDGCDFDGCGFSPLHIVQIPDGSFQVKFVNCRASKFGENDSDAPLVLLESKHVDEPKPAMPDISGLVCANMGTRARCLVSTRNFTSIGEKDVPYLDADVAGAHIVDKLHGEFAKCSPIRMQYGLQFAVYADRPRMVRLRARRATWNDARKPLPKGSISVTTWAGAAVAKLSLPDHDSTELAFYAPDTGFYRMSTHVSGCSFIVDETDAPIAVSCDCAPKGKPRLPLRFSRCTGSLYVPVAAGHEAAFLVGGDMPGDKVGVRVFNPAEKLVFRKDAVLCWTRYVSPKAEKDGLWRVEFVKPSNSDMWGFYAEVAGVHPFFFLSPKKYWYSE